jgi:dihydroorotate dehydrogenase electron transfer subunit
MGENMGVKVKCKLVKKEKLIDGIYKFSVEAPEIANVAKAGQFLEIKVSDTGEPFLRRPISIYNICKKEGIVEFIFQVKGRGTDLLKDKEEGDTIDIMGPLGFGSFKIDNYKKVAIIGGGIGTYPLYELAKELKENSDVTMYMGFRNKELVTLEKEFEEVSNKLVITTDDGSYKQKGFAINVLKEDCKIEKPDIIFACGPLPMLKAVREFAIEQNIPCQISLEERMGCGIGACLGCAVKVISGQEPRFGHVCKEGPVFNAKDVEI